MKHLLALLFTCVVAAHSFAQSTDPKVQKAYEAFDKDQEKGIKKMEKIIKKDGSASNYNALIEMTKYRYFSMSKVLSQASSSSDLGYQILSSLLQTYWQDVVDVSLRAEVYSQSQLASAIIRINYVDYQPDSARSKAAKAKFRKAEEWFGNENYETAAKYYRQTLDIDSSYYKARIYLGDCYWHLEEYEKAVKNFRIGIAQYADLLEPRKYLVDALMANGKYQEAIPEIIATLMIYPDNGMYVRLDSCYTTTRKKYDRKWVQRKCQVNQMEVIPEKEAKGAWAVYESARVDIKAFCDDKGIITSDNKFTKSKYMEVYSWEKMLKSDELTEDLLPIKKIMDEGYLDCHVFLSQFSYLFYDQYKDFVENNEDRIQEYIEKYLVK